MSNTTKKEGNMQYTFATNKLLNADKLVVQAKALIELCELPENEMRAACFNELLRYIVKRKLNIGRGGLYTRFLHNLKYFSPYDYGKSWRCLPQEKQAEVIKFVDSAVRPAKYLTFEYVRMEAQYYRENWTIEPKDGDYWGRSDPFSPDAAAIAIDPPPKEAKFQRAAFVVDWKRGKQSIKESFARWVDDNAPSGTPGTPGNPDITYGPGRKNISELQDILWWLAITVQLEENSNISLAAKAFGRSRSSIRSANHSLRATLAKWFGVSAVPDTAHQEGASR